MSEFKIFETGLVRTKVHGMNQDAFVVTEDKMNNFNSYSFEFQVVLVLFSTSLGAALGNLNNVSGTAFVVSIILTVVFIFCLIWTWLKFNKTRKTLFLKSEDVITTDDFTMPCIVKAIYGTTKNNIDVTEKLRALIKDNKLSVVASNEIDHDPDKGEKKTMIIIYRFEGRGYTRIYIEGDLINLP